MEEAAFRLSEFVGREVVEFSEVDLRTDYDVGYVLGDLAEISYIAERDGEIFQFEHEFAEQSRPLLIVSHDGKQLIIAGGRYDVSDRGIIDR